MHEIPETMAQVAALVEQAKRTGTHYSTDTVIRLGLQNWFQELLDEGFEGGYLTATLTDQGLTVTGITGSVVYHDPDVRPADWLAHFKADPHATLMAAQTLIRQLIATHQIQF